jgi:hypothetical protein
LLPRTPLRALASASLLVSLLVPGAARAAGAVYTPTPAAGPTHEVRVDMAVATRPEGSVRWARASVKGATRVMWLVPVRRGAAADWSGDAWLDALDAASRPIVMRPTTTPPGCTLASGPLATTSFSASAAPRKWPIAFAVFDEDIGARAYAVSRGFVVDNAAAERLAAVHAAGWVFIAFELSSNVAAFRTPALRVEDSGAGDVLPFALVGDANAVTQATVFVVSSGPSTLAGAVELSPGSLSWSRVGSSYETDRDKLLGASATPVWMRESESADAFFSPTKVTDGGIIPSVAEAYFASQAQAATCAATARSAAQSAKRAGMACAAGALTRVPGGSPCVASEGELSPSTFSCGTLDDLALAMSGRAVNEATVSRWATLIKPGAYGADARISPSAAAGKSAALRASVAECGPVPVPVPPPATHWPATPPTSSAAPTAADDGPTTSVRRTESCSGSTSSTVSSSDDYYDDGYYGEGCGGSTTSSSSGSSSSSSGSGSSDSWGSSDDYDDSSSSDDSSSDSWGDADDWDGMSPKAKKLKLDGHTKLDRKHKRGRGPSPLSRAAFALVALALPLRRAKKWLERR